MQAHDLDKCMYASSRGCMYAISVDVCMQVLKLLGKKPLICHSHYMVGAAQGSCLALSGPCCTSAMCAHSMQAAVLNRKVSKRF
jgi:hypothetical protein